MRHRALPTLLCCLALSAHADNSQYETEAREITDAFFQELKGELGKNMKSGGPLAALRVCSVISPAIASKHSEATGWDVARTSLKLRNPKNAPDAWERSVLEQFEARRADGESPKTLVHTETVTEKDGEYFRFMKAIVMPPADKMPCLTCHGDNIDSEITSVLDQLYPMDRARDYNEGQVRGAFTLKKKL